MADKKVTDELRKELHRELDLILNRRVRFENLSEKTERSPCAFHPSTDNILNLQLDDGTSRAKYFLLESQGVIWDVNRSVVLRPAGSERKYFIDELSATEMFFPRTESLDLSSNAVCFLADLIGPTILDWINPRSVSADGPEVRRVLIDALKLVLPLFRHETDPAASGDTLFEDLIRALRALDVGEVLPVLVPKTGKNIEPGRYQLVRHRLVAVLWARHLKKSNQQSFSLAIVAEAFGVSASTIRRWDRECEEWLNPHEARRFAVHSDVRDPAEFARMVLGPHCSTMTVDQCGGAYRECLQRVRPGKKKPRRSDMP